VKNTDKRPTVRTNSNQNRDSQRGKKTCKDSE
jgi:hypothetical protein